MLGIESIVCRNKDYIFEWNILRWAFDKGLNDDKFLMVLDYITDLLANTGYYIGTIKNIAEEVNVSVYTVKKVLNYMKEDGHIVQTYPHIYRKAIKIGKEVFIASPHDYPLTESERKHFLEYENKEKQLNSNVSNINFERTKLSSKLRYEILQRDGFKCQICGATQADGVKLEIDHIKPISKGGKTEPDNLRTLCRECNRGKKNSYNPDSQYN